MLGSGGAHGEASLRWIVERMKRDFVPPKRTKPVTPFSEPRVVDFGDGPRTTWRFDFSDQHAVGGATRMCFDSPFLSMLIAVVRPLLRFVSTDAVLRVLRLVNVGSEVFAVRAQVGTRHRSLHGRDVTALAVLRSKTPTAGNLEHVVDVPTLLEALRHESVLEKTFEYPDAIAR